MSGFPIPKDRKYELAQSLLKRALSNVREARDRIGVAPDSEMSQMFDVMEEYLEGIPGILKALSVLAAERAGDEAG